MRSLSLRGGRTLWLSGPMSGVTFTCFRLVLMLTSVANVPITISVAPLFAAMLAQRVLARTWLAIAVAGAGIAWMYGHSLSADSKAIAGTVVSLGVSIAATINWNALQRSGGQVDLAPALLIGKRPASPS